MGCPGKRTEVLAATGVTFMVGGEHAEATHRGGCCVVLTRSESPHDFRHTHLPLPTLPMAFVARTLVRGTCSYAMHLIFKLPL